MRIGIDAIGFYTPPYYVDLRDLAEARHVDPLKYLVGLGLDKMSVSSPDEDTITMASEAVEEALKNHKAESIDMVLFATETTTDFSRAGGLWLKQFFNFPKHCRFYEIKQACYAGTAALEIARYFILGNPMKKVLIVASDIARYGFGSSAEATQGAGAIACVLTSNPGLLEIESFAGVHTEDTLDFWRPIDKKEAFVNGKLSLQAYMRCLRAAYNAFKNESGFGGKDIDVFCFHTPFPKIHKKAAAEIGVSSCENAIVYNKQVGNCYTASLLISVLSLLENSDADFVGQRLGLYSYGSGAIGQFFSCIVQPEYKTRLNYSRHAHMLSTRQRLLISEYERFYKVDKSLNHVAYKQGYRITSITEGKRNYQFARKTLAQTAA